MPKKKIIIRVDGNSNIGLGHIYRGIALAEMLKEEFSITFIIKTNTTISPITDAGFEYILLQENINLLQEPLWFKDNFTLDTIIILDGYDFTEEYQQKIKEYNFKLVYIDDLANHHMYADIIINHSLAYNKIDYRAESYTKFALGLDYAILRPKFIEAIKIKRNIKAIDTAFVCFGGADPNNFTSLVAESLLEISQIKRINIVIGNTNNDKSIFDLEKKNRKIKIFKNLSEDGMIDIMNQCNIAIVPSSNILLETLAVKMIVFSGYYVDNQKKIYESLKKKEVIIPLENILNINQNKLIEIINQNLKTNNKLINNQKKLFPKNIKTNYLKLINSL